MKTHRIANILDSNFIDLQGVTAMTIDEKIRLISKDFSTLFGCDLQTAAILLEKYFDNMVAGISPMRHYDINFTDEQKKDMQGFLEQKDQLSVQRLIVYAIEKKNKKLGS